MSIVAMIAALGLGGVRLGISARDVGEQTVDTYQRLRISLSNSSKNFNPLIRYLSVR